MGLSENIELFLENTKLMRDRIHANPEVLEMIRKAIEGGTWLDGTYCRIIPWELGIKTRDEYDQKVAVSVKADVYSPDIPMTPFAIVLHHPSRNPLYRYYLVQDLGEVSDADDRAFLERNSRLLPALEELETHLDRKGYVEDRSQRFHSLGHARGRIVIHDLDCGTMERHDQILRGATTGRGPYAHLAEIYRILASPEYSLRL
jgi:hypothetical protein